MALTPQDVQQKLFTTVRLREGYETTEVDEFCEEVEAELTRLLKEVDELQTQLASAQQAPAPAEGPAGAAGSAAGEPTPRTVAPQEIVVRTSGEVSAAAARVLEMAQRTADEYLSEVRAEADQLVSDARATAERLTTDAQSQADAVDRETHERTTVLERQIAEQRQEALDRLREEKRQLERDAETLRSFEREYRGRLRTFLESQLNQLAGGEASGDTPLAPAGSSSPHADSDEGAATSPHADSDEGAATSPQPADLSAPDDVAQAALSHSGHSGQAGPAADGDATIDPTSVDGLDETSTPPRSAFGRILEEEEREAQGR